MICRLGAQEDGARFNLIRLQKTLIKKKFVIFITYQIDQIVCHGYQSFHVYHIFGWRVHIIHCIAVDDDQCPQISQDQILLLLLRSNSRILRLLQTHYFAANAISLTWVINPDKTLSCNASFIYDILAYASMIQPYLIVLHNIQPSSVKFYCKFFNNLSEG